MSFRTGASQKIILLSFNQKIVSYLGNNEHF